MDIEAVKEKIWIVVQERLLLKQPKQKNGNRPIPTPTLPLKGRECIEVNLNDR